MPLYEYICLGCHQPFTLLQSLSAKPDETLCPHCGEKKSQRLFSPFSSKVSREISFSPQGGAHCHTGGCGCA